MLTVQFDIYVVSVNHCDRENLTADSEMKLLYHDLWILVDFQVSAARNLTRKQLEKTTNYIIYSPM